MWRWLVCGNIPTNGPVWNIPRELCDRPRRAMICVKWSDIWDMRDTIISTSWNTWDYQTRECKWTLLEMWQKLCDNLVRDSPCFYVFSSCRPIFSGQQASHPHKVLLYESCSKYRVCQSWLLKMRDSEVNKCYFKLLRNIKFYHWTVQEVIYSRWSTINWFISEF